MAHGAKEGQIPESKRETIEDETGDTGRGLTLQDPFGSGKKFYLYPKGKGNHEWDVSIMNRFTYWSPFT